MNAPILVGGLDSSLIELDDRPRSLRLPRGSAIFPLRGEVWLTQERRSDDVILAAGSRYDVADRAPIVVSATHGRAALYVAPPADARAVAATDLHAFLREQAVRLRRDELAHLTDAAIGRTAAFGRGVLARLRATLRMNHRAAA